MDLRYSIVYISIIAISLSIPHVFADISNTPWKIIIKGTPLKTNSTLFWPSELQAREGDTIEWQNEDTVAHTVTSGMPNHSEYAGKIFDSGIINPGDRFSFNIPSKNWSAYYYYCKIHPWITGKIDVGDAYLHQSPEFSINTNKISYHHNEIINIFGVVNDTYQIMPLSIQIFDSQRNLVFVGQTDLLKDHSFSYQLAASHSIFNSSGNYKIKAFYGFPATVTDVNFSIYDDSKSNITTVYHIASWIKSNAGRWSTGQISNQDFIKSMEYLIKLNYIQVSKTNHVPTESNIIPSWIRNNAGLWANNAISDQEFISGLQYLINQGIIQV